MKGLKRFGALLVCMMILVSCMIPSAFANNDPNNANLGNGGGELKTTGEVSSINGVKATVTGNTGDDMELNITGITDVKDNGQSVWQKIFSQYRGVIVGLSGIGAITMIVFFIINFMKLGASSGNPQQRTQALVGIIWCGLAAAGLGGVTIFVGFFYNMLG